MKMIISLVIEATENDIHEIKGKILETASEAMVSCSVDVIPEQKKELQIPDFMKCGGHTYTNEIKQKVEELTKLKREINRAYGKGCLQ